jgi:hypothetical protein
MSPDIEWHVGEDAEHETIARTTTTRRLPRRRLIVISAIGLGVILGLLYRSIPEPPPQPPIGSPPIAAAIASPARSVPQPTPESLDAAIERDAQRLASSAGEANHLIAFAAPGEKFADWYAALQNAFGRWGTPPAQALYTVSFSGTLPGGAWVTLGQYRHGAVYHSTRFYRLENDRRVWALPDQEFWSGATSVITTNAGLLGPITIQYPIEDTSLISPVLDRFSSVYQNLCVSLKCPTTDDQSPLRTLGLTVSLTIKPMLTRPVWHTFSGTLQIDLPSPNLVGVYDEANALGDPYVAMAYDTLIGPAARLASGDYVRWDTNNNGSLFLEAVATWKRARLPSNLYLLDVFYQSTILPPSVDMSPSGRLVSRRDFYVNQLRGVKLVPLADLWTWPTAGWSPAVAPGQAPMQEAQAVIIYIEERYGPAGVVRFLNSLGTARSLEAAIKTSLSIDYAEFDQQWGKWIAGK